MLNCQGLTEKLLKTNLLAENELNKLKTFDSSNFIQDGTQNYLVFQPLEK